MNRNKETKGILICALVVIGIFLVTGRDVKADFVVGTAEILGTAVNSSANEWMPRVSADGLSLIFQRDYDDEAQAWIARRETTQDPWNPAVRPEGASASERLSSLGIIPGDMTMDGLEFYFWTVMPGGYGNSDIYVGTRETIDSAWAAEPVNLGALVNSAYYEIMPSISPDGLELYFSDYTSNIVRPGGYGDGDIWMTRRATRNDPWQETVNIGPQVNSPASDARVHISADGLLLFFDSKRDGGYGGADIYLTKRETLSNPWGEAINLGPNVNGPGSEFNPGIFPDGRTLFFVRDHDIWHVSIEPIVDLNSDGIVDSADMCIVVDNWGTDDPLCDFGPMPWGDGIVDVQDLIVLAEHLFEDYRLVAHWKLDEAGGNTAYDSVGDKDGTCHGGPLWQPAGGRVGGALLFDGTNDYISPPFILDPKVGSFSAFAWIKGGAPGQVIISQADGTGFGTRWLWADPSYGRLMSWLMHPPFDPLVSESVITDDQWHHIGLVYDIDGLKRYLYVDGKEVAKDTYVVGGIDSDGRMYFGANKTLDAAAFFSGLIDDVRIYDAALSAEEIATLAQ